MHVTGHVHIGKVHRQSRVNWRRNHASLVARCSYDFILECMPQSLQVAWKLSYKNNLIHNLIQIRVTIEILEQTLVKCVLRMYAIFLEQSNHLNNV